MAQWPFKPDPCGKPLANCEARRAYQHPESEAFDLFLGSAAAILVGKRRHSVLRDGIARRSLYGDDLCGLCGLWRLRGKSTRLDPRIRSRNALAQPVFRRDLRGLGRKIGVRACMRIDKPLANSAACRIS